MTQNQDAFNNALSVLDSLNNENATEMWVPSLGKMIRLKPLTASNQRDMIATLAGTRYFPSALAITIYDVIKDTCIDKDVDIDNLNSIDKIALVLQLRAANIQDHVSLQLDEKTQVECDVLNDGLPFKKSVSIKSWVKNLRTAVFDTTPEVITSGKLSVEVGIPTFASEYKFQQQIYNVSRSAKDGQQVATTEQILGHVFLNTICQFVRKITVDDITIDFADATPQQCIQLVSKIRGDLLKQVGTAINKFEQTTKQLSTVQFNLCKNSFSGTIAVDNSLFEQ